MFVLVHKNVAFCRGRISLRDKKKITVLLENFDNVNILKLNTKTNLTPFFDPSVLFETFRKNVDECKWNICMHFKSDSTSCAILL